MKNKNFFSKVSSYLKIFLYIIGPRNKNKLKYIFFLNFILSIFEFISISIFLPIIIILVKNDLGNYLGSYPSIKNILDEYSLNEQIIFALLLINIVFIFRYFFILYLNKYKIKFVNNVFEDISSKVFIANIFSHYEKIISYSNPEMVKSIYHECAEFCKNILSALISISGEVLKILAIVIILLWIDYLAVIMGVIFFSTFALVFLSYQKSKIKSWGITSIFSFEKIIRFINEGFASIKEVKLIKNKNFFFDNYNIFLKKFTEAKFKKEVLSQIARPLMELFFIILISILILILIFN